MLDYTGYVSVTINDYIRCLKFIDTHGTKDLKGHKVGSYMALMFVGTVDWNGKQKYFVHMTLAEKVGIEYAEQKIEQKVRNLDKEEAEKKEQRKRQVRIKQEIQILVSNLDLDGDV